MRKIGLFYVSVLMAAAFVSCESEIKMGDIVGKWCLASIESEINGEICSEPIIPAEGDVYYEFRGDSTYVLSDLGASECGKWILCGDSLLGTLPSECEDDSANYAWVKIESLNDSVMSVSNTTDTDYGVVNERHVYRRRDFKPSY